MWKSFKLKLQGKTWKRWDNKKWKYTPWSNIGRLNTEISSPTYFDKKKQTDFGNYMEDQN